jgi:hypothetical protein
METTSEQNKLDLDKWKIRITPKRKNRMKLQFNLDKDESLAFKNFSDMFQPLLAAKKGVEVEKYSQDQFIRDVFIQGFNAINTEFTSFMNQAMLENEEELKELGAEVVKNEDGSVTLKEAEVKEETKDE